ncbi:MAG: AsmA family protein [Betaproteobacteria bacterium]|nr:AsmA family protein [Acidobacteriota bacterium]MBI4191846.1 AsmA family protein [Betaproteobacteria bacterium]
MNKIVKFVVLPLVGIVLVVVALATYIAATFDPNQYKPQIAQAVKDKTGRTLELEGGIKLSLFPGIGATLGKASLSERASDREFAGVDDLRVALKLMPLLSKEIVVDTIEIKNLRANLIRNKDGKFSIDDLIGGGNKSAPAAKSGGPQVRIDIDHVAIENATITYTDQRAGAKYAFSRLNLKTGRIAGGVPSRIDLSFVVQSDKPKLNLDAALKTTITFDLDRQHYVLDGLDLTAKGLAAGISNLAASVKGNVDAKPASNEFVIAKLAIAATAKQEGGNLNVRFDLPRLNVTKDKVSGEKIALDATLSEGKSKLVAKLDIPGIDGNAQAFKANGFTASVDLQQDGATIKAKVTSPLAGSVDAERIELSKLVATVSVNNPKLPKNPLDATLNGAAQVDLARQNARLAFAAKIDDSNINGKVGLAKFTPPFYTFDISIDQLDADRYWPKPDPKRKQPEQPFDLSALKGLNASGSLRIGTLKMANAKASNVRFDVRAARSRVDVSPLAANLHQGSLAGALSAPAAATPVVER